MTAPEQKGQSAVAGVVESSPTVAAETHPWRRWFARLTDYYLAALLFGFVTAFVPSLAGIWDNTSLANMVAVAFFVPVEAWLVWTFGTTAGKALLGIKVTVNGEAPSFEQALHRAWNVYLRGMGLGLPLVSVLTMAHQHGKLKKEGAATYDRDSVVSVTHSAVKPARVAGLVLLWLVLLALIVYGSLPEEGA